MAGLQLENKQKGYDVIEQSLRGLLRTAPPLLWESALVSLIALLKEHLGVLSWVGFYRNHAGHLWIGPYQGKLACLYLKPGQGVCGKALQTKSTIVVDDVEKFIGHVYCDPLARSEIVIPVFHAGALVGVLDLDSHVPGAFNATDQIVLERLVKEIETLPDRVILD
ncbi:MAG: GAF domain-containing protein [Deltaproteobacteria bacterium]|nr:GAF domain-containing protein [Deltaproteobacteria bacterium]